MATPQQNELRRSTHNAADPEAPKSDLAAAKVPATADAPGPVPEENQPGHHPEIDQDQPSEVQDRRKG